MRVPGNAATEALSSNVYLHCLQDNAVSTKGASHAECTNTWLRARSARAVARPSEYAVGGCAAPAPELPPTPASAAPRTNKLGARKRRGSHARVLATGALAKAGMSRGASMVRCHGVLRTLSLEGERRHGRRHLRGHLRSDGGRRLLGRRRQAQEAQSRVNALGAHVGTHHRLLHSVALLQLPTRTSIDRRL